MHDLSLQDQTTEFLLYTTPNGEVKVEVLLSNETLWLTQERMADLFGVQKPLMMYSLSSWVAQMRNWVAWVEFTR
jgi:hypothetical protein